jgi:hypothetical protein
LASDAQTAIQKHKNMKNQGNVSPSKINSTIMDSKDREVDKIPNKDFLKNNCKNDQQN